MRRGIGKLTMASAMTLAMGIGSAQAADVQWDNGNGDNDWFTATNWAGDVQPVTGTGTTGDRTFINLAGANKAVFSTASATVNYYRALQVGNGATGEVDFVSGLFTADSSEDLLVGAAGGTGTLTVTGGTFNAGAGLSKIGTGAGSTGTFNAAGGTIIFGRENAGRTLLVGDGTGTGTVNVSGTGTILRTRAGTILGNGAGSIGTFSVEGSGVAEIGIGSHASVDGAWVQNSGSTLRIRIDTTATGVRPIFIDDTGATSTSPALENRDGNVSFKAGSLLDVGFLGADNYGTFTVMTWEGTLLENNLAFAPSVNTDIWSFAVVGNSLQVTATAAVPEPASVALMGLAGLALLPRRRRQG